MGLSRRELVATATAAALAPGSAPRAQPSGPLTGSWDSLAAGYRTPDWYRDAKFGIWAHWGPQCVPEFGDWYGRLMYIQGDPFYAHHLATYGHPSKFGMMEFIGRWKAENWDPERLMGLYKKAGAKYFVSLANHHDNFDTFNSPSHPWNATRVGPMRDIVGTWAKVARAHGMKFGVSNHGAHAWHWYQAAYGYDPEGPLKGVRYDAWRLRKADGRGKWWEGLDPQALYTGPNMAPPDGIASIAAMNAWHDSHDGVWTETPPANNPAFVRSWLTRCRDLIDQYRPDFLYYDNTGLPLGQAGLDATAHYYNQSLAWHGKLDVVATGKKLDDLQRRAITEDVERGFSDHLRPEPWQTDTCIGDWHYNRRRFTDHSYVPAKAVVQRLCDVVAKNGNLLLSIPVRGDGTIDADEEAILADLAAWFAINGEAIYGTRPWKIYGEGPTQVSAGMMNEEKAKPWTAADIRFTTKAGALFALPLEWPAGGELTIASLAQGSRWAPGSVERVQVLGGGELRHRRDSEGLHITLPDQRPATFCPAVRIEGRGLV